MDFSEIEEKYVGTQRQVAYFRKVLLRVTI
jgi:hypothetical protein